MERARNGRGYVVGAVVGWGIKQESPERTGLSLGLFVGVAQFRTSAAPVVMGGTNVNFC